MQIGRIELTQLLQPGLFKQVVVFPLGRDETFVPKLLQGSVGVDDR